ncbi:SDR family NAD(P)-dependent oxidoreductase [Nocardioides sp. SOB77]|uniref:SDR family NAD(P)-dependent oxidoreductase n=1 Tax=Nocardioides oceani TaxID=3058369 RepID=A0ABT8FDB5_9ACTN|nr:SDR family NAD(P)-dependent oxidoreductase [Nocardioides oceani]MDN4172167.1 SDR family NAD(P)-dependent oxidoreductase [Nocardioides oceani]
MSSTPLAGRTAVVTGAGAGLGRAEALALAAAGANVVINDVGPAAEEVAAEARELGVGAVAVTGDVSQWAMGDRLVAAAVDGFGSLDIVVNNAGVTRDTMLFNLDESQWDTVLDVHLKGHAALSRAAAVHWRGASKAAGAPVYGRIVNTSSEAFLFGPAGQPNYAAAKAGITALTLSSAQGLARYGVTANAICPRARTGMTAGVFDADPSGAELDILAPERVATFVAWLASPASATVSGQVFVVYGDMVALMAAPTVERTFTARDGVFSLEELDEQLVPHFAGRSPHQTFAAYSVAQLDTTGVQNISR